jgi:hypothetical protein
MSTALSTRPAQLVPVLLPKHSGASALGFTVASHFLSISDAAFVSSLLIHSAVFGSLAGGVQEDAGNGALVRRLLHFA